MNYKIIIEKKETNPNFEAEYAEWKQQVQWGNRYSEGNIQPKRELITDALICELTEEQFKSVKASVMQSFE